MIEKLILENKIDKFIIRLIIFVNNYYKYELEYIKDKYNINSHNDFIKYFKKNYKKKILFSSMESENLFINIINMDINFMIQKYNTDLPSRIIFFLISRKKLYFNKCHFENKHDKNFYNRIKI